MTLFRRLPSSTVQFSLVRSLHTSVVAQSAHNLTLIRTNINDLYKKYHNNEKITVITAHDYISGKIANDAGADAVLVGDSLAMVSLGYEDTNEMPFDEFLYHCKAVRRGVDRSFIIADLPFGSFESSIDKAIESSISLVSKGRANAVKIEGGEEISDTVRAITNAGIPVVAHVGLTPQRANALGGFKVQGRSVKNALRILKDSLALQEAGACAMVIEAVPSKLASYITQRLRIPTIGIGAGSSTSGQVLVQADALGLLEGDLAKFVKKYSNGYEIGKEALKRYCSEVKELKFPEEGTHTYKIKSEVLQEFIREADKLV